MSDLFPFQRTGAAWLRRQRCALLADEMGLGKSVQVIRALEDIAPSSDRARVLIICPASVRPVWAAELERWLLMPPEAGGWHVRIASYDEVRINPDQFSEYDPTALVLDESHYLKSPGAQRTRRILGASGLVHGASVRRIWCLSGTPAPNHAGELFTLAKTFGLTTLNRTAWDRTYCILERGIGRAIGTNPRGRKVIREMFEPVMLRRAKKDVLQDLPPIFHSELPVELDPSPPVEWLSEDDRTKLETIGQLQESLREAVAAGGFEAMKRLAVSMSTLRRYIGLQKVYPLARYLIDMYETPASNGEEARALPRKVIVFAHHTAVLRGLAQACRALNPVVLDGSTTPRQRKEIVTRFQNDRATQLFLGQTTAAGTGITLTAASDVVILEPSWVPGENLQAAMRAHRIGQRESVSVRWVVGNDALDRTVMGVLRSKAAELNDVLGGSYEDFARIQRR